MLKRPENARRTEFRPMEKEEWTKVVGKASKRSASSFFSKRNYVMYKITLTNERMTDLNKILQCDNSSSIFPGQMVKNPGSVD